MNKFWKLTLLFLLICNMLQPALSQVTDDNSEILDAISKIGIDKSICQDPKKEIIKLFDNHTTYAIKHDSENLKKLYSDNYISSDGFDKATYFEMIMKTWELYPIVDYTTLVKNISINGDYATVEVVESAVGETKEKIESVNDTGKIEAASDSYYFLQKIGNSWKITGLNVIAENTSLKYGDAKNLQIDLNAPSMVKSGESYTISITSEMPASSFILASLTNEPISFPQNQPKEVFRNLKRNGILERVLKANSDNCNEYAVASLGITKAAIVNGQKININLSGMAFVMARINVINHTPGKFVPTTEVKK